MFTIKLCTPDCKSLATSKLKSGKPQLCLNREVGHAEAGKIIIFICGKSIVVFHCFSLLVARLLQSAVPTFTQLYLQCSQLEMVFMHEQNLLEENVHTIIYLLYVLS